MENKSNYIELNEDFITRCLKCNLICSIKTKYKEGDLYIIYECDNQHFGEILFKDYLNKFQKHSLSNEKCKCGTSQKEKKENFFYCSKCNLFVCGFCQKEHSNEEHDLINYKRYDSLCKEHSNFFDSYCLSCKKNLCVFCNEEHKKHNIINLIGISEESRENFINEIKELEIIVGNLNNIKNNLSRKIDQITELSLIEIQYRNLIFNTYEYENSQKNLNYYAIQNFKNCQITNLNKIQYYNKLYEEGDNYITFLDNMKNIQVNNFKIINKQNSTLYYNIEQLKDGRLASCSNKKSLTIYNKINFEPELIIVDHLNYIISFTQLNNGKIITCSGDNTMKLINLIGENNYYIEQTLKGHKNEVYKVIEIRDNELISNSKDKTMKVWKLNDENKFICVNNINIENSGNLLKLNEEVFVSLENSINNLKFWNSHFFTEIKTINKINNSYSTQNLCLLDDDILGVGGNEYNGIYIIKISTYQLIKNIIDPFEIISIKKYKDYFICSGYYEGRSIMKYKYENEDFEKIYEIYNAHEKQILSCVVLDDNIFGSGEIIASSGYDNIIKLWVN